MQKEQLFEEIDSIEGVLNVLVFVDSSFATDVESVRDDFDKLGDFINDELPDGFDDLLVDTMNFIEEIIDDVEMGDESLPGLALGDEDLKKIKGISHNCRTFHYFDLF